MCRRILTEYLNMRRTAAKFLPRLLNDEPKQNLLVCKITLQRTESSFLRSSDLVLFPEIKIQLSGRRLGVNVEIEAEQHHETEVPELLPTVPETLCPVYKLRSRLHQGDSTGL